MSSVLLQRICIQKTRRSQIIGKPVLPSYSSPRNPEDKLWFVNSPMGKNKIGQFLSSAKKNLPMSTSSKFTHCSVIKTCIKTLLDSGVSHNNVAQISGHKSLESLDSYVKLWRTVNSNSRCRKYSVGKKTTPRPNRSQMHRSEENPGSFKKQQRSRIHANNQFIFRSKQ